MVERRGHGLVSESERYGQMQYRYCGKSGLRLPRYRSVYGTISVTLMHWNHSVDPAQSV